MNFRGAFDGLITFMVICAICIFAVGYGCNSITSDYSIKIAKQEKK